MFHNLLSYRLILSVFIALISYTLVSQTSKGKEFWFGFMENYQSTATLEVHICSELPASGTISMPAIGWSQNFNVTSNATTSIIVPTTQAMAVGVGIQQMGISLISDVNITVYALNYKSASSDATIVLPKKDLGYKYYVSTYKPEGLLSTVPSEFIIVATEDNTIINITPTANINSGASSGMQFAGNLYSITLNKGELYQGQSTGDLTGTLIEVINGEQSCMNISVFSGNVCTNVGGCSYCDHLFEALLPVPIWGREYIAIPFKNRLGDQFTILASENGTTVDVGGNIQYLNAGEKYLYFTDTEHYINSNEPICLTQFCTGNQCNNLDGDPLMIIHSPLNQRLNDIYFNAFVSNMITDYYMNVITPNTNTNNLILDGQNINSQLSPLPSNSAYSYAKVEISSGNHNLTSDEGMVAYIYGFGGPESYGYSAGNSLIDFTDSFSVVNLSNTDTAICVFDKIQFNEYLSPDVLSWKWDFGDNTSSTEHNPEYFYENIGTYNAKLILERNCVTDTVYKTIEVVECIENKPVLPNAFSPNNDGINDQLFVEGKSIGPFALNVYDRWGKIVFTCNNKSKGWDGKYKGQAQPVGSYAYVFTGTVNDIAFIDKGNISLIR